MLLLVSGPIAVGKSTVVAQLLQRHGFQSAGTGSHLRKLCADRGLQESRTILQELGDQLDLDTDFTWVVDVIREKISGGSGSRFLLDAVRKHRQVEHLRAAFGTNVHHIHFVAPDNVLRKRYETRDNNEGVSFEDAIWHPNEVASRRLAEIADFVVDLSSTAATDAADTVVRVLRQRTQEEHRATGRID